MFRSCDTASPNIIFIFIHQDSEQRLHEHEILLPSNHKLKQ